MNARQSLGHAMVMASLAAATTWAALLSWRGFLVGPDEYLGPLLGVAVVVTLIGGTLRGLGVPTVLTLVAQTAAAGLVVCRAVGGSFLPTEATRAQIRTAVAEALDSAQQYAAPIGDDVPSVAPLLILGGTALILLVDLLACGLRRVPISGLALLAVYSVPAGIATPGSAWFSFLCATAGFLTLLHLDTRDRLLRWGRGLGPVAGNPLAETNPVSDAVRAGAGRIALTATALAVAVPLFVPVMDLDLFAVGGGGGDDQIRIRKPVTDMRRDLERGADIPLVRLATGDPDPSYLRIAVLNRYTGSEWSSGDRDVNSANRTEGELPVPVGLAPEVPRRTYDYRLVISADFESTWLPTPFPAAAVEARGDWRFDPATMDFLATDDSTTAGMSYRATSLELDYGGDGRFFGESSSLAVGEETLELPGTPENVQFWARSVTRTATTDYDRATLLQQWFRTEFDYSLERAPEGVGNTTLGSFLSPGGRVGYCEQFASAMAVMARMLDIPARVAVGFLRPSRNQDGTWTYSSHDLHAWPELYFSGAGWVRFEPTPAARAGTTPSYSRVPEAAGGGSGTDGGDPGQSDDVPDSQRLIEPGPEDALAADDAAAEGAGDNRLWHSATFRIALLALLGVVLLVGALAPRRLRERRRERRLAGGPDAIWSELHASAIDLGIRWPEGRSPREIGAGLVPHLGVPAVDPARAGPAGSTDAGQALWRIVSTVEHHRYAPPDASSGVGETVTVREDATTVLAALAAGTTPRARRRAVWWPRTWAQRQVSAADLPDLELQPEPVG